MSKKKAWLIRNLPAKFRGDAAHYWVPDGAPDFDGEKHEHVIISAAVVPYSGPETYVFPADEGGKIQNWFEMPASGRGYLDHTRAIENI